VLGGLSASLVNFRGPLIQALLADGHLVTAVAGNYDAQVEMTLRSWGADYTAVKLSRSGMNPFSDLGTLWTLVRLIRRVKPHIFLGYTVKPVTLGLIAARLAGTPQRYGMVTGLGYAFTPGREIKRLVAKLASSLAYWLALRHADGVIFQNGDDEKEFRARGFLSAQTDILRVAGSGVDVEAFAQKPLPSGVNFLMIARLLLDKGIREYLAAARVVRERIGLARFVLAGPFDPNPATLSRAELERATAEGTVEYVGEVADVRPLLEACSVYVLPSYREGMPRTVLEAMAVGRAIITTNTPGCRDAIADGENGMLVPPRNAVLLAEAMITLADAPERIAAMAEQSRRRAERHFDSRMIARQIAHFITRVAGEAGVRVGSSVYSEIPQ
jgi:glycosyltransferase involved in cell wall biosynthesis